MFNEGMESVNLIEVPAESRLNELIAKNQAKLNDFYKRHIQFQRKIKHDSVSRIKDHLAVNTFGLPPELSEQFIYYESAPHYWTYPSQALEILYKIYNINPKRLIKSNPQKIIFDFYLRWSASVNQNDSKYFALSIIKQIRNSRKNAINLLLHGVILAFEKSLYNPDSALSQFEETENLLVAKELDETESLELKYVIRLFKAFVSIKYIQRE